MRATASSRFFTGRYFVWKNGAYRNLSAALRLGRAYTASLQPNAQTRFRIEARPKIRPSRRIFVLDSFSGPIKDRVRLIARSRK